MQLEITLIDSQATSYSENQYRLGIILASMRRETNAYHTPPPEHQHIIDKLSATIDAIDDMLEA